MSPKYTRMGLLGVSAWLFLGCEAATDADLEQLDSVEQAVFVAVPAKLEAENYERAFETTTENHGRQCDRADGVDKETTTDTGGGCNVGWTASGEWLEYDINVPATAYFSIISRVASDVAGRTFHINVDGTSLGTLTAPSPGWQTWADRTYTNVKLNAGNHTLRVVFDTGDVNLNYLQLTQNAATCTDGLKNGNETGVDCGGSCAPCSTGCVEQELSRNAAEASTIENANTPAIFAIDANTSSRWSSAFADPQWLRVDLGAARKVSRVRLDWETAAARDYTIQVSPDGNAWTTLVSKTGMPQGNHRIDDLTGLSGVGRYVRMHSTARATEWGNSLYDFKVFGDNNPNCSSTQPTCTDGVKNGLESDVDCGGSTCSPCQNGKSCNRASDCANNYCVGGRCETYPTCTDGIQNGSETGIDCGGGCPACASCTDGVQNGNETGVDCGGSCPACSTSGCQSNALPRNSATASTLEDASYPANYAIDGSTATRWASAYADPQWIYVDLGATRFVNRVVLNWEVAASANYRVDVSDSTSGPWSPLYATALGNGGIDDLTGLSGKGRYVRMFSAARTTNWGNSLWDFAVYGDLNPNCGSSTTDADGDRLTDAQEATLGTNPNNPDTDGDGLPDGDEELGTTAGLNLKAMGANPRRKDVLVEFDWFEQCDFDCWQDANHNTHRPSATVVANLIAAFKRAPVLNHDNTWGINLIIDYGQGGNGMTGGNGIVDSDDVIDGGFQTEFYNHKAANFAPNRGGYFHYMLFAHHYATNSGSSGLGEVIGDDTIVSLWCDTNNDAMVQNTIMHELGHNLGLHHGGPCRGVNKDYCDGTNYKPNYNSVMNYSFQFPGADSNCDRSGDGVLDYSRGERINLDENALNESVGMCQNQSIDWNYSGGIDGGLISYDVNGDGMMNSDVTNDGITDPLPLRDYNDWNYLVLDFAPSAPSGAALLTAAPMVAVCDAPVHP